MTDPRGARPSAALLVAIALGWGLVMPLGGMAVCWRSAENLRDLVRIARWPVVSATITTPIVQMQDLPEIRHRPAMRVWCARWRYDYAWQGAHHGGELLDDLSSLSARGCYVYETTARHAAERRPAGSSLAVRVNPDDPWQSTTQPIEVPLLDIGMVLVFGLGPVIAAARMLRLVVVAWRRPRVP